MIDKLVSLQHLK